jgi:hypothetical protein
METSLIPTHYTYIVNDDGGKQIATCQIHKYCDKGIVYGLFGRGSLEAITRDLVSGKFKEGGILTIEGYVRDSILPAIEREIARVGGAVFTCSKKCEVDGFPSTWVKVERIEYGGDD